MNAKKRANSVSRCVMIFHPFAAQWRSREGLQTESAYRKNHRRQIDLTHEHARVAFLLIIGRRSEMKHSRDIRGAIEILATGIYEK